MTNDPRAALAPDEWRAVLAAVNYANDCHNEACDHYACRAGNLDSLVARVTQAMKWPLFDEAVRNGILDGIEVAAATPEATARLTPAPQPDREALDVERLRETLVDAGFSRDEVRGITGIVRAALAPTTPESRE